MALLNDLQALLTSKGQELAAQITREADWQRAIDDFYERSSWYQNHNQDAIQTALNAHNDALANIARLQGEIAAIRDQIAELTTASAEFVATGMTPDQAFSLAEKELGERIKAKKAEEEAKKSNEKRNTIIIISVLSLVTIGICVAIFRAIRRKLKAKKAA
jgi:hypothetical protein